MPASDRSASGFGDRHPEFLTGDVLGLRPAADPGVQPVDRGELIGCQLEIEDVEEEDEDDLMEDTSDIGDDDMPEVKEHTGPKGDDKE